MLADLERELAGALHAQARAMRSLADAYLQKAEATEAVIKLCRQIAEELPAPMRNVYLHRAAALEHLVVVCQGQAATCDKEADRVEKEAHAAGHQGQRSTSSASAGEPAHAAYGIPEATGAP